MAPGEPPGGARRVCAPGPPGGCLCAGDDRRGGGLRVVEPTTDRGRKLAALAQRLRVLHTELADQSAEMRSEQLRDEVQRAVSQVPAQEREEFLKELIQRFPTWSGNAAPAAAPAPAAKAATAAEIKDPRALAEKLMEASRGLTEKERSEIAMRLAGVGLTLKEQVKSAAPPASSGAVPELAALELKKALGLP